jgi:hypothetical protein
MSDRRILQGTDVKSRALDNSVTSYRALAESNSEDNLAAELNATVARALAKCATGRK